jgi:hypothetical protein
MIDDDDVVTASEITGRLTRALSPYFPVDEIVLGRAVRHWAGHNLLRAIGGPHTGRGRDRIFRNEEILRAALLFQISNFFIPVGPMKLMMKEIDEEIAAVAPSKDIVYLLDHTARQYFVWSTLGYPNTYRLAFTARHPAPPEALYPRLYVNARKWREALQL